MDYSPETTKPTTTTASSHSLTDSPIFSYISNLPPIKPVKTAPVAQGFPGLNSPPLVYSLPRIDPHGQSSSPKRFENKDDVRKDAEMAEVAGLATLEQAEENGEERSSFDTKPYEVEVERGCGDVASCPYLKKEPGLTIDHAFDTENYQILVNENAGAVHKVGLDCSSQLVPESMHIIQEHENCCETTESISTEPVENLMLHDAKV